MTPLDEYEDTSRAWCAAPNSAGRNRYFVRNHALFKAIRSTPDGQALIRRLAQDTDECVAGHAATHALWFDEAFGLPILAKVAEANSEAGLSAHWTLRELARGALNLDW